MIFARSKRERSRVRNSSSNDLAIVVWRNQRVTVTDHNHRHRWTLKEQRRMQPITPERFNELPTHTHKLIDIAGYRFMRKDECKGQPLYSFFGFTCDFCESKAPMTPSHVAFVDASDDVGYVCCKDCFAKLGLPLTETARREHTRQLKSGKVVAVRASKVRKIDTNGQS